MNDQVKIKSDNSFLFYFCILLFGGMGMIFGCYKLILISLNEEYPQILGLIIGGILGIIGTLSIYSIYKLDKLFIFKEYLEIKSIFGNTKRIIHLDKIITWTEIEKRNKYLTWTDLTLYTEQNKYKFTSSYYNNYTEIKNVLVKGKPRDSQKQNNWQRRNNFYYAIGFSILGSLFLYGAVRQFQKKDIEINSSQLQTITDKIISEPTIYKGSKGSRSIKIKLNSFPTFRFEISGYGYQACYAGDYIENVKLGDTIKLDILKDQYKMKLSKEKPLGFWDKSINYSQISVYGLRFKNYTYLDLNDYNKEIRNQSPFGIWVFGIMGLGFILFGIYTFKLK